MRAIAICVAGGSRRGIHPVARPIWPNFSKFKTECVSEFSDQPDVMYKPSISLYARVSYERRRAANFVKRERLRLASPSMLRPQRNVASARRCELDTWRHMALRDVREFVRCGFNRAAAQKNIFALAPSDLSIFG